MRRLLLLLSTVLLAPHLYAQGPEACVPGTAVDTLEPGTHALPLDATRWASGAYAVRVAVGTATVTRRFVVMR